MAARAWHVVCARFSWCGWTHERGRRILGPARDAAAWRTVLARPPDTDFLLVESVWADFEPYFHKERELRALVTAFHGAGIPVLFWNKEDPLHFDRFVSIALLCDAVFTTDAGCVPRYRKRGFRGPIEVLTFPVQPRIHRPYHPQDRCGRVFFAGSYRTTHPDRVSAMRQILVPARRLGCLDIFARRTVTMSRTDWPVAYQPCIVAELPYETLIREYSRYPLGLSISSTRASSTMYPRRVVEVPMADVMVISDDSLAVRTLFPEVPVARNAREARRLIEYNLRDDSERVGRLKALQERILKRHTYKLALGALRSTPPG